MSAIGEGANVSFRHFRPKPSSIGRSSEGVARSANQSSTAPPACGLLRPAVRLAPHPPPKTNPGLVDVIPANRGTFPPRTQGDISTWQEWGHSYLGLTLRRGRAVRKWRLKYLRSVAEQADRISGKRCPSFFIAEYHPDSFEVLLKPVLPIALQHVFHVHYFESGNEPEQVFGQPTGLFSPDARLSRIRWSNSSLDPTSSSRRG
jgi:hypothetical protein